MMEKFAESQGQFHIFQVETTVNTGRGFEKLCFPQKSPEQYRKFLGQNTMKINNLPLYMIPKL